MGAYEHVILLLSFVYALALTHLLSRVGGLVLARRRVRFSGLLALAQANAILMVFINWLYLWNLHGIDGWSVMSISPEFLFAGALFFQCVLAAPEPTAEGAVDMEAFYWEQRRPYYAAGLSMQAIGIADLAFYSTNSASGVSWTEVAATALLSLPQALAFLAPARWAQWAGGVILLLMTLTWAAIFVGGLH
jgi:hypothetical protein